MASPLDHGFEAFRPGDNPYDVGNRAVRRLAQLTGVVLSKEPSDDEIQELFLAWGKQPEFQANIEGLQVRLSEERDLTDEVAAIMDDSGILREVDPRNIVGESAAKFDQVIIGGGVTNWMYRRLRHVENLSQRGCRFGRAVLLGGERVMGSPTEANLQFVLEWQAEHGGALPTEADYLRDHVMVRLAHIGIEGTLLTAAKTGFADMVREAAAEGLLGGTVYVAQNAPAGSTFADVLPVTGRARLYFGSDGVAIARTSEQMSPSEALRYQNPFSAASALVRWVKAVHEVNKGTSQALAT